MEVPTDGTIPLNDIAFYAFRHYALFAWLVERQQPTFPDGPTVPEVAEMVDGGNTLVSKLTKNGPSSIYLALKDGYSNPPPQVTERLILLALMAERPSLIPNIIRVFPGTRDPLLLRSVLRPYTNSDMTAYESDPPISIGDKLIRAIYEMGKIRLQQNQLLRFAVKARYGMVTVLADPSLFGTSSLGEIGDLVSRIDMLQISNPVLYSGFSNIISILKLNFEKVKGVVNVGAGITQDAVRRLRLLLNTINASDALFDKLSGTAAPKQLADSLMA
jgi:hypothetical protein